MTRLIDADKLETHEQLVPFGNGMYESTFVVYKDNIDEQPTVDAVPIEWILKWKENFKKAYSDEYDVSVAEMLVDMLEDWREENGKTD